MPKIAPRLTRTRAGVSPVEVSKVIWPPPLSELRRPRILIGPKDPGPVFLLSLFFFPPFLDADERSDMCRHEHLTISRKPIYIPEGLRRKEERKKP